MDFFSSVLSLLNHFYLTHKFSSCIIFLSSAMLYYFFDFFYHLFPLPFLNHTSFSKNFLIVSPFPSKSLLLYHLLSFPYHFLIYQPRFPHRFSLFIIFSLFPPSFPQHLSFLSLFLKGAVSRDFLPLFFFINRTHLGP